MVLGNLPARRRRQLLHLLDAHPELLRRDERRDPAVAEPCRALLRRLALAADPDGWRILPGLREDRDTVELEELTLKSHLVLSPEETHDPDRFVGPPASLLEGHTRGVELSR